MRVKSRRPFDARSSTKRASEFSFVIEDVTGPLHRFATDRKRRDRVRKLVRISRGFQPQIGETSLAQHLSRHRLKTVYQPGTSLRYTRRLLYTLGTLGTVSGLPLRATPGINPRCSGS